MHREILSKEQSELLLLIQQFKKTFYLVGGTAIALHLGHRRSIDFDLFSDKILKKITIKKIIGNTTYKTVKLFEDSDQLHYVVNDVKITFFTFPYNIPHVVNFENIIQLPSLLDLASMKAFALARRAKWKDYVDLFFIIKYHYSVKDISRHALNIFKHEFNEKLFREQLAFHKDIDYSDQIEYLVQPVDENEIKSFLIEKAIDIF